MNIAQVWENDDAALNEVNEVALKEMTQVAVKSRKAGGEGVVHTRTHVKFGSDGESSDEEYNDMAKEHTDSGTIDREGGLQGDGKAFDHGLDDLTYLKMKASDWKDSSDEEEEADDVGDEGMDQDLDENAAADENVVEQKKPSGDRKGKVNFDDLSDPSGGEEAGDDEIRDMEVDTTETESRARPLPELDEDEEYEEGRLMIKNLPYCTTEEEVMAFFKKFGELSEVHMCIDKNTKRPTGLAFLLYLHPADAEKARQATDERYYQGRVIMVEPAKRKLKKVEEEGGEGGGYKAKKARQLQKTAGSSHNWNMLFMRSDTVAEAVAKGHSLSKGELLDHEGAQSMAVRMALGETHVIDQTKKLLRENGVNVAALEVEKKPEVRSKIAMLVKNIPHSTEDGELRDLFGRFGNLSRLVLPATKTMALVEFDEPSEARSAFRGLAYSKFKNQPIYLEWAPENIFIDSAGDDPSKTADADQSGQRKQTRAKEDADGSVANKGAQSKQSSAPAGVLSVASAEQKEGSVAGATLYVKNLSFATKEAALKTAMAQGGKVKAVKIMTKPNPNDRQSRLSMGYGFVEFSTVKDAQTALTKLQGAELDGHKLQIKLSSRVGAEESGDGNVAGSAGGAKQTMKKGKGDETNTRLVLRNVPFEATRKELRELLAAFGELTSVRLPKKFDGTHRGFAFADFVTHQEAAAAREALRATHLYGRHLVIEWAEEEQSLEAVRRKTARYFSKLSESGDGTAKRRKIEEALEGGDDGDDNAFEDAFR